MKKLIIFLVSFLLSIVLLIFQIRVGELISINSVSANLLIPFLVFLAVYTTRIYIYTNNINTWNI